jgi:hypothetical protein
MIQHHSDDRKSLIEDMYDVSVPGFDKTYPDEPCKFL